MHDPERESAIAAASKAAEWHAGREGLGATFERIVVAGDAAVASFVVDAGRRMIVGLERAGGDWDVLNSRVIGPEQGGFESFRPSEHRTGHWTIIAAGLAPDGASRAAIALAGHQHIVPVTERLYLFAVALEGEPEPERLPISFG